MLIICDTKEEVDSLWKKLSEDGTALMPLEAYPFSERYGWTEDRYGLSWQVMYLDDGEITQKITPTLMFTKKQLGRAEEAVSFYTSVFNDSKIGDILRYSAGEEPDKEGTIKHVGFKLEGQEFAAMDSARVHDFAFNEAVSFIVYCKDQAEIDYYWENLSAVAEAEQCGWLKDRFGFSWQIIPTVINEMMQSKDSNRVARVTESFLKMKKFDIEELKRAYNGR